MVSPPVVSTDGHDFGERLVALQTKIRAAADGKARNICHYNFVAGIQNICCKFLTSTRYIFHKFSFFCCYLFVCLILSLFLISFSFILSFFLLTNERLRSKSYL